VIKSGDGHGHPNIRIPLLDARLKAGHDDQNGEQQNLN
jgi:hypothetical protein